MISGYRNVFVECSKNIFSLKVINHNALMRIERPISDVNHEVLIRLLEGTGCIVL